MLDDTRFSMYRQTVAFFTWLGFRDQKVYPLEAPAPGAVRFRPYATAFPDMPIARLLRRRGLPGVRRCLRRGSSG